MSGFPGVQHDQLLNLLKAVGNPYGEQSQVLTMRHGWAQVRRFWTTWMGGPNGYSYAWRRSRTRIPLVALGEALEKPSSCFDALLVKSQAHTMSAARRQNKFLSFYHLPSSCKNAKTARFRQGCLACQPCAPGWPSHPPQGPNPLAPTRCASDRPRPVA